MRLVYGATDGCGKNEPGSGRRIASGGGSGGRGGIGRRTGFRFSRCKSWGFKDPRPHRGAAWGRVRPDNYGLRFMQMTEISAEGLKRELTVTVPAGDLEQGIT